MQSRMQRMGLAAGASLTAAALAAGALITLTAQSASAATVTVVPTADTRVQSNAATTNYGTSTTLGVDASEVQQTFMKFNITGVTGTITSAKLRVHVKNASGAESTSGGTWKLMSNTSWSETGVTYNNRPAIDGATLGTIGSVAINTWYEIDVTGKIPSSGVISIGGSSTSSNGADFDSRETTLDPQLVITTGTEPSPSPTTTTTAPPPSGDPIFVGAGDIASTGSGDNATANLIAAMPSSATVFAAGDNAYPDGTLSNYNTNYHPSWGQFKARTIPAPGNHEYHTSGASGYFDYFGALAGPNRNGWFSKDIGNWHVISLNSEVNMAAGSPQETWLRQDLAANSKPCTIAMWHSPLFTSGSHGPDSSVRPLYQALYDHNADVVVTGHNHNYERFAPMNPSGAVDNTRGIRHFVNGAGGSSHYNFTSVAANSQARNADTYGVLKFTLHANSYDWQFVPESGKTWTDSGTTACH
ncbi:DUF7594 domain-containing protein [Nocardioides cavernaquae]|nr:DNRLRE domain-containing protein [Nocardioides cavernaquae]